jgi:exodeoxyribonuclease V beta subunit
LPGADPRQQSLNCCIASASSSGARLWLRQRLENLLTGRIDLVYEVDGRYYLLDYKSNQLRGYDQQSLARRYGTHTTCSTSSTTGADRWLRFKLGAGYDIRRHLRSVTCSAAARP